MQTRNAVLSCDSSSDPNSKHHTAQILRTQEALKEQAKQPHGKLMLKNLTEQIKARLTTLKIGAPNHSKEESKGITSSEQPKSRRVLKMDKSTRQSNFLESAGAQSIHKPSDRYAFNEKVGTMSVKVQPDSATSKVIRLPRKPSRNSMKSSTCMSQMRPDNSREFISKDKICWIK